MADPTPSAIRAAREALGLSQAAVARAMQGQGHRWHQTTVGRLECGGRALQASEVLPLAAALGVHPMALLGADPDAPSTTYLDGWRAGRDAALSRITAAVQEIARD